MNNVLKIPFGYLRVSAANGYITHIEFSKNKFLSQGSSFFEEEKLIKCALKQLGEYFSGLRTNFDLPYKFEGNKNFSKSVWQEISKIKFGKVKTYKDLAIAVKKERAFQAVGTACGANPLPILVPCHRVVASSGKGGFAWGSEAKDWLLNHEGVVVD